MKTKSIKLLVFGIALSLFNVSCSSEMDTNPENLGATSNLKTTSTSKSSKKAKFKKETSLLIGRLLSKKEVRDEVLSEMKKVSPDGEVISFGYLLGKNKGIRKNEKGKLTSKLSKKSNLFSQSLAKELEENKEDYVAIRELISKKNKVASTSRYSIEEDPFSGENLQLYSPYNEVNGYSATSYDRYYTSEETEDGSPTNSGYYFNGFDETYIPSMDNNFIDSHPSFIISTIDDCDLEGGVCTTIELLAAGVPPPLITAPVLLTYSVDHNNIPDADIVSSRIPMLKINGTDWMEFGGTHQKMRIFRGSYEGGMTQNADGTISVTGLKYQIGEDFRTKRRNARKSNWITFNTEFDPDWNQSENTQQLVIFSLHKWRGSDEISAGVKYGLKKNDKGGWDSAPEATGAASVKFTSGSSIFRANSELPRRQVLSTITGDGSTGKTYSDGGVLYNVKSVGIVDYYYKHWYTDLQ
ncbi:hypothetical protein E0I26_00650 [Flavobacterium rhamnosiphilum]|uniref:Lipoprotein n=1 Tax=Flavobacterium rhamnosiphilum TaxID=2541724 RepID=A0A4V2Z9Q7_9FLAO|nr:hypothetical protein [Flavobacterium rhamnosiphilum]TDE46624.1 hypothetical protein E0I26_00650 [Flavobacterium rhamnosiphilum]